MEALARLISAVIPENHGFCLLVFPFTKNGGKLNYISDAQRPDVVKVLKQFISKTEGAWGEHKQ